MANVNRPQKVATVTFMSVLSGLRIDLSQRFAVGARGIGPALKSDGWSMPTPPLTGMAAGNPVGQGGSATVRWRSP